MREDRGSGGFRLSVRFGGGGRSITVCLGQPIRRPLELSVGGAVTGDGSSANGRPTMIRGFDTRWLVVTIVRKSFMLFERPDTCASMCCLIWSRAVNEKGYHKGMIGSLFDSRSMFRDKRRFSLISPFRIARTR